MLNAFQKLIQDHQTPETPLAPWLSEARALGRNALTTMEPSLSGSESWKYAKLSAVALPESVPSSRDPSAGAAQVAKIPSARFDHEGWRVSPEARSSGCIALFSDPGFVDTSARQAVDLHLSRAIAPEEPFEALNLALLGDGLSIQSSPSGSTHEVSLRPAAASMPACLSTVVDADHEMTLIEHRDGGDGLLNFVCDITLGPGSSLIHVVLSDGSDADSASLSSTRVRAMTGAHYVRHEFAADAGFSRSLTRIGLAGDDAEVTINGAFVAVNGAHQEIRSVLEHQGRRCQSRTAVHGLVGSSGRGVFNGRIHIHEGARDADAVLNSRNLILDDTGEVDTKPELEIYCDQVKCAHGATVGQLDRDALFFLQSRGIDAETSARMLCKGFLKTRVDALPSEALKASVLSALVRTL